MPDTIDAEFEFMIEELEEILQWGVDCGFIDLDAFEEEKKKLVADELKKSFTRWV